LVVTTLGVEGMPLLRFKTGDMLRFHTEKCKCGKTSMRAGPVVGRVNNLLKYKGTTLYPPAIYDVLDNTPYMENYLVEVSLNDSGNDEIIIKISITESARYSILNTDYSILIKELKDRFRAKIRVAPEIEICDAADLRKIIFPDTSRKPVKFIDKRKRN